MSILVHSPVGRSSYGEADGAAVTTALYLVAATAAALLIATPVALFFPALALATTLFATATGIMAWLGAGRRRSQALAMASVFAFAAGASAIIGDPMRVAQLIK
mgnify:CR=1 FL=1